MDTFFSTIYYYTNGLYGQELDNYLYETVPGYVQVGLAMIVLSGIITAVFYYMLKPVRKQWRIWLLCLGLNAFLNLLIALWYTNTPLINNEIDDSETWTVLDTFGFDVQMFFGLLLQFLCCLCSSSGGVLQNIFLLKNSKNLAVYELVRFCNWRFGFESVALAYHAACSRSPNR